MPADGCGSATSGPPTPMSKGGSTITGKRIDDVAGHKAFDLTISR